jgi:hypothetical protein
MWGDRRFAGLTERGKLLWCYLLTGPDVTSLPGLLVVGRAHLAEAMGWDLRTLERVWAELSVSNEDGIPMAEADWSSRVVWLPMAWKHNTPANPSVVAGWKDAWRVIPECDLKERAAVVLASKVKPLGRLYALALDRVFGTVQDTVPDTVSDTVSETVADTSSTPSLVRVRAAPAPAPALSLGGSRGGAVTLDEPMPTSCAARVETVSMTTGWKPSDIQAEWLKFLGAVATKFPRSELESRWQKWLADAKGYAAKETRREKANGTYGRHPVPRQQTPADAPWLPKD